MALNQNTLFHTLINSKMLLKLIILYKVNHQIRDSINCIFIFLINRTMLHQKSI
jgi:hypothetical protein